MSNRLCRAIVCSTPRSRGRSACASVVMTQRGAARNTDACTSDPSASAWPTQSFSTKPVSPSTAITTFGRNRAAPRTRCRARARPGCASVAVVTTCSGAASKKVPGRDDADRSSRDRVALRIRDAVEIGRVALVRPRPSGGGRLEAHRPADRARQHVVHLRDRRCRRSRRRAASSAPAAGSAPACGSVEVIGPALEQHAPATRVLRARDLARLLIDERVRAVAEQTVFADDRACRSPRRASTSPDTGRSLRSASALAHCSTRTPSRTIQ